MKYPLITIFSATVSLPLRPKYLPQHPTAETSRPVSFP